MRMLAVAACLAAFVSVTVGSAPAEAQQCAPGSYPSVDSFGNQVCKRFSDQSTSAAQGRRCIIPAISICEWTGPQGSKTKHMITRADGAPLFLAGLWASHTWEDERTESYTMVMQDTAPGDDMHIFHNRQPVVLDRERASTWLDCGADYASLMAGPPAGTLVADPPEPAVA